jgi:uncharacterized protein
VNDPREIRRALETARAIAVVGCSPNPARPSHQIAETLLEAGYRVVPVNPGHREILGQPCHPSLGSVPRDVPIDIVDVFRRSEHVASVADEAIARGGVSFFWMQLGVVDPAAARRLQTAGIAVAMDRCIAVELARLGPSLRRNSPV